MIIWDKSEYIQECQDRRLLASNGPWQHEKDVYVGRFFDPDTEIEFPVLVGRNREIGNLCTLVNTKDIIEESVLETWFDKIDIVSIVDIKIIKLKHASLNDSLTETENEFLSNNFKGVTFSGNSYKDFVPFIFCESRDPQTYQTIGKITERIDKICQEIIKESGILV